MAPDDVFLSTNSGHLFSMAFLTLLVVDKGGPSQLFCSATIVAAAAAA